MKPLLKEVCAVNPPET